MVRSEARRGVVTPSCLFAHRRSATIKLSLPCLPRRSPPVCVLCPSVSVGLCSPGEERGGIFALSIAPIAVLLYRSPFLATSLFLSFLSSFLPSRSPAHPPACGGSHGRYLCVSSSVSVAPSAPEYYGACSPFSRTVIHKQHSDITFRRSVSARLVSQRHASRRRRRTNASVRTNSYARTRLRVYRMCVRSARDTHRARNTPHDVSERYTYIYI